MATKKTTPNQPKELSVAEQKVASHALQHGITHTVLKFPEYTPADIQKLIDRATKTR